MDAIDIKLLQLLSQNADATATELATHVNLSIAAINKRIVKMKEAGVIRRACVLTDPKKIGKPVIAYVFFALRDNEDRLRFPERLSLLPDVLECYSVTGEHDYLIKVCAETIEAFDEKLRSFRDACNVSNLRTIFALHEWKYDPVPMPDDGFAEKKERSGERARFARGDVS